MKSVLKRIDQRTAEFSKLPLFDFLRDASVPADRKLCFAPCMAHFIMSFGDLNKYILRDLSSQDPVQKIVNQYSYEDETHWQLFLEDLQALEQDARMHFTDSLKTVWGDDTAMTRILSYKLCALAYKGKPVVNLAMIETMEAAAKVFFNLTLPISQRLRAWSGVECKYFGGAHLAQEQDHSFGQHGNALEGLSFTDEDVDAALHVVDDVFDAFHDFIDELWSYTQVSLSKPPASTDFSRAPLSIPPMSGVGFAVEEPMPDSMPASAVTEKRAARPMRTLQRRTGT